MQQIYYAYEEFREDLKALTKKIDQPFDVIVAISRGGLSMGQMLGEFYDIREVYAINTIGYDDTKKLEEVNVFNLPCLKSQQRVLVVDDIVDSGDTLVEVLKVLQKSYPQTTFQTASLFFKPTAIIEPTWWVKEPKGWIVFFWSEDLKE
jgi:xanthine phosphoribosyltransferase